MYPDEYDPELILMVYDLEQEKLENQMVAYQNEISKYGLEFSSNLYEKSRTETIFWQQIFFDYFDFQKE